MPWSTSSVELPLAVTKAHVPLFGVLTRVADFVATFAAQTQSCVN